MASNYLYILDFGHSGVDASGKYLTAPAKQHQFPDGLLIQEGVINRKIGKLVAGELTRLRIDHFIVSDEVVDTPLSIRVQRADDIYAKDKRAIFISIHSNAGGGSGNEIFTSPGQSKSDKVAHIFCDTYQKCLPEFPLRKDLSDGDADKEADFYVLRKTDCPAVLLENLFFDNRKEAEFLLSEEGQKKISNCIVLCIQNLEKIKPI